MAVAAAALLSALVASEGSATASCASRAPATAVPLPAPIVVTTDCGRYRFDASGRISFRRGFASPVPKGTTGYYMDLTWYRIRPGGHLTIGHRMRTLWHSRARLPERYADIGAVVSSPSAIAYTVFHGRRQSLFAARLGRPERLIATGETSLGFTRAGALVSQRRWTLLVRDGREWQPRRRIGGASDVVFDHAARAVYFLARGRLERFDGTGASAPPGDE